MARSSTIITILLADAEHVFRKGLRCLLNLEKDFQVVGEVADGLDAVLRVGRLRPRVALIEVALPGLDGLEVTRRIRESLPDGIAHRLGISARTAEAHRANALSKLGLRNRVEVVRYALARGILTPPGGVTTA